MRAWLIDVYRKGNNLVVWLKTAERDIRIEKSFIPVIYVKACKAAAEYLDGRYSYSVVRKRDYLHSWVKVYAIPVKENFELFIKKFEKATDYRVPLYNADVLPEQQFIFENKLIPFKAVFVEGNKIYASSEEASISLSKAEISFFGETIIMNNKTYSLNDFVSAFNRFDPDIVIMDYAFSQLPKLVSLAPGTKFHRWDPRTIKYKGGKSFFSYGSVTYRDFAIRLNGRLLVDSTSVVGSHCTPEAIIELCELSSKRFQQTASRSFGSVFQACLLRQMYYEGMLIPYKEKPIDKPISFLELLKSDRAGHYMDPKIGFHKDVAEIDFTSMFPWLMYNRNVSADMLECNKPPFDKVPGIPVVISRHHRGLIPKAIKPLIDRRMHYKKNPTALNKERAAGLKWVLVSSYGYLRFREFKMGIAQSHMAVCAYSREILIAAMHLAESKGFEVVHGIVDSLYIKKQGIKESEVRDFIRELEIISGIPISFEGIFKWIVFLPSVTEKERPLPATYYGVFRNGKIKARGIEVRQRSPPMLVKEFQEKVLEKMSTCNDYNEIVRSAPLYGRMLRELVTEIPSMNASLLVSKARISKIDYKHNIPQANAISQLKKRGIEVRPGMTVKYLYSRGKTVILEEYLGDPDITRYTNLLVRSLFVLLQAFGFSKQEVRELTKKELQLQLN